MRISSAEVQRVLGAYVERAHSRRGPESGAAIGRQDRVEISSRSATFAKAMLEYTRQPEVREERVAEIRGRIQAGTYRLTDEMIAERMLLGSRLEPGKGKS